MKYGNVTNPYEDLIKEIRIVRQMGFDFVEIGLEGPEGDWRIARKKIAQIRKLLKHFDKPPIVHTAWYMELGSSSEVMRNAWLEEFKQIIDTADMLGAHFVNTHFHGMELRYSKRAAHKATLRKQFAKSLNESIRYAKRHGIEIMIENTPQMSLEETKKLFKKVPGLKLHLDIGHAFVKVPMKNVENFILDFGPRIAHIHIHDNHGKQDEHLPLGRGKIDFARVAKALKAIGYDRTMTFEVFTRNRERDVLASRRYFDKLWARA